MIGARLPDAEPERRRARERGIHALLDDVIGLFDRLFVLGPERLDFGAELLHLFEREIHHRIGSSPRRPAPRRLRPRPAGALAFNATKFALSAKRRLKSGHLPSGYPSADLSVLAVLDLSARRANVVGNHGERSTIHPGSLGRGWVDALPGRAATRRRHHHRPADVPAGRATPQARCHNGIWRYDPAEVVRLAAMRTDPGRRSVGQTAAAAFHMFDTGVEFKDCVILLQLSPGDVRRLYREWQSSFDDPPPEPERAGRRAPR